MILRGIIGLAMGAGLSACSGTPMATVDAPRFAQGGSYAPALDGVSYAATIGAGPVGKVLTPLGAQVIAGQTIRVSPFAMDEGKRAKDVARLACAQAKGRYQPQAIGRFSGGAWSFEGGCA